MSRGGWLLICAEQRLERVRWHRSREVVALRVGAPHIHERAELLRRLYPLGDRVQPQTADQGNDTAHERGAAVARSHLGDERAVDLDAVGREARQIAQRGVAGAEVVDEDAHAERLELADRA